MTATALRHEVEGARDLIAALSHRYTHDPKLAYEIVTGACCWPPINGETLDDLIADAEDRLAELCDDIADGEHVPSLRMEMLQAAVNAFGNIQDMQKWAEEAADDGMRMVTVTRMEG